MRIFSKKYSDPDLAGVAFVVKARSKNGYSRSDLELVFMDKNGELVATDGHRCHKYKMKNPVVPGHHMVVVNIKTKIILVPVDSPRDPPDYNKVFGTIENHVDLACGIDSSVAKVIRTLPQISGINIKYLQDALSGEMDNAKCGDGLQPIVLTGKDISAAVMPTRM